MTSERTVFQTYQFALIICRNPFKESKDYGKWLAVNEVRNRGWWIPGGAVDAGESFIQAAHRECLEEAGIRITLKGVLKIDHSVSQADQARMRVIFYAEPASLEESTRIKKVADKESLEARWVSLNDLLELDQTAPGLRGDELLQWGNYLEKGGHCYPLSLISGESRQGPTP